MAVLVIQTGKHAGRKVQLPHHAVVVGRDEGCFLKLSGSDVSRRHCELKPVAGGWVVRDLDSQNGTFVNSERIAAETRLCLGDDLLIGHMHFQWEGPRKGTDSTSVLEDSIVDWLSERDTSLPPGQRGGTGDTTILTASDTAETSSDIPAAPPASAPPPVSQKAASQKVLATASTGLPPHAVSASSGDRRIPLVEEAREVIRQFVEEVGDKKPPALADE